MKLIRKRKLTHISRRLGTPQNFCLAFIDKLEKQLFIRKNCWSGPIKNVRILIFAMFFKKKKNKEKHLEISLFYTCLPRTTIIWGTVPELRSETNIIFLSFWAIFLPSCLPSNLKNQNFEKTKKLLWRCHHFTNVYQKSQSCNICFLRYGDWQTYRHNFLWFWAIFFCHFTLLMNPKIWKKGKKPGDIILLYMCSINENHMYGSRDMECNRQNYVSFWTIFYHFTPLTTQKIEALKIWKKRLDISWFCTFVP